MRRKGKDWVVNRHTSMIAIAKKKKICDVAIGKIIIITPNHRGLSGSDHNLYWHTLYSFRSQKKIHFQKKKMFFFHRYTLGRPIF